MTRSSSEPIFHDLITQLRQKIEKILPPAKSISKAPSTSRYPSNSALEKTDDLSSEALENAEQRNKIKTLSELIHYVDKNSELFKEHISSIQNDIQGILESDQSFVKHEKKDQLLIARHSFPSIETDAIDSRLTTRIVAQTNTSLINALIALVPGELGMKIIVDILNLKDIDSLQHRQEIIPIAFDQRILAERDFTSIFKPLINKGLSSIPANYSDLIASNERATSGHNARKLNQLFFEAGLFDGFSM